MFTSMHREAQWKSTPEIETKKEIVEPKMYPEIPTIQKTEKR